MRKIKFKIIFSTLILVSTLIISDSISAAPVKFKQVVQVVNATPGKANTQSFSKLRLADASAVRMISDGDGDGDGDDDKDKKKKTTEVLPQDGRVITTTIAEITDDEDCQCAEELPFTATKSGFPKWPLFGLGAVPLGFIKTGDDKTPTPTPTTATPTPTTPPVTPEPTPEPMTLLLFGTGLAGVGFAARKKFGKKSKSENAE